MELGLALLSKLSYLFLLGVFDIAFVLRDGLESGLLCGGLTGESLLRLILLLVLLGDLDHECDVLGLAARALEVTLQLLLLRDEVLNVLLVYQDLLRERKTQGLSCWLLRTTICSVLDVVDHKQTVLSTSEEEVVIVTDLHSLNGLAMSLYLIDLSELRHLEYVNGTGLAFFADTSNESLLVGCEYDLRELHARIEPVLVVLAVPDLAVVADGVHLERLARDVDD